MIAPMKKVSILIYHRVRDEFLAKLQDNGLVHIIEHKDDVQSENLTRYQAMVNRLEKASISITDLYKGRGQGRDDVAQTEHKDAGQLLVAVEKLFSRYDAIQQRLSMFEKRLQMLEPWGAYDFAAFEKLRAAGINPRFFVCSASRYLSLDLKGLYMSVIRKTDTDVFFAVYEKGERVSLDCEEVQLPKQDLAYVRMAIEENRKLEKRTVAKLLDFYKYIDFLKRQEAQFRSRVEYEKTLLNLSEEAKGSVHVLQGWVPAEKQLHLENFLLRNKVAYYVEDPEPDDDIPVLLKNRKFPKLLEPITNLFALPDYGELDPTPFFAPFFIFFYGMCLGDMGYGAMVFALALAARLKGPENLKGIFTLGMLLGFMTMVNGMLLNSFFGKEIFSVQGVHGLFAGGASVGFLGSFVVDGKSQFPAIPFSMLVGMCQVILGMILNAVNKYRQKGALYAIQPLSNIPITVAAIIGLAKANFLDLGVFRINSLAIGPFLAGISAGTVYFLLILGILPFMFFNNADKKIFVRPLIFLWEAYNYASGLVADGLSYLRLFALGLAGSLLGYAFNNIGLMLITDKSGVVHWASWPVLGTVVILLLGHLLNFGLSALGAYVHSVRLIFVEFYGNLDFQGGGKPFKPFSKKTIQ